jgi:hypothetical protein
LFGCGGVGTEYGLLLNSLETACPVLKFGGVGVVYALSSAPLNWLFGTEYALSFATLVAAGGFGGASNTC